MINPKELIENAEKQLALCDEIHIASIDPEGYPRVCVVTPLKTEGFGVFWFISAVTSEKIRQFSANPKAGACYGSGNERQLLTGYMTIIEDVTIKHELWRKSLTKWFPRGPADSEICAVKFTAERATLWHLGKTAIVCCE